MKLNAVILSGLIIGALAVGIIIGRMTDEAMLNRAPVPGTVSTSPTSAANFAFEQQRSFEEVRSADAPRARAGERAGFNFERLVLDSTQARSPTACLEFSQPLEETEGSTGRSGRVPSRGGEAENERSQSRSETEIGNTDTIYTDYIDIKPAAKIAVTAVGRQLCLSGLGYSQNYQVTVKAGLANAAGETLLQNQTVLVSFGDKPPFISFAGNGYVLPRLESDGIGLETVNVARLHISIRHINDRALIFKSLSSGDNVPEESNGDPWGERSGLDVGVPVWEGEIPVDSQLNEKAITVFPVGAALGEARRESLETAGGGLKPGAYFVYVKDASDGAEKERPARAWRWLLFTDMSLSSYQSDNGIDVVVRSLKSARPMPGVEVALIARNNEVLTKKISDGDGLVRFPAAITRGREARTPKLITAYGSWADFALLDLSKAGLDLSDRAVAGREAASQKTAWQIDPYFYTDRGIYRPGEMVHLTGLLRDRQVQAVTERPLNVKLRRPNGTIADNIRIEKLSLGGFSHQIPLPKSAPRGVWHIDIIVDGAEEMRGVTSFNVEDFVPQRLKVSIDETDDGALTKAGRYPLGLMADFLYGAPGAGLQVEGEARLQVDPAPFPSYADYSFGKEQQSFTQKRLELGKTVTDGAGKANLVLAIDRIETTGRPLRANIVVGVAEPGGRFVTQSKRIPVRLDERYIGIRHSLTQKSGKGAPSKFDVLILDAAGEQLKSDNNVWRIYEEEYRFEWYRQNNEWRWRRNYSDILIATGRIELTAGKPATLAHKLRAGTYRLEVENPKTGAISSMTFYKGWRSYGNAARVPDEAVLTPPDYSVKPGDRARLTLDAPYEGEVYLAIATDRIHEFKRFNLKGGAQDITLSTKAEWGNGFYVLATIVTPRDAVDRPVPRRAMGIAYVPFDKSASTFDLSLQTPEVIRPSQTINVTGKIKGGVKGENIFMTLSAVDEGILQLTKFQSPAPADFYFAKKALGVTLNDNYAKLLNPNLAAPTRFGGDSLGGEGLSVVPTMSVALFKGPVKVQTDGTFTIPVQIPDFNGALRLMAVAWSADKLGSLAKEMIVRDAVPASLSLPRFLAPNDEIRAALSVDNVDGIAGDYLVTLKSEGGVEMDAVDRFTLDRSSRVLRAVPVKATAVGLGELQLSASGPEFSVSRSYPIEVRAPYYPVTNATVTTLKPGGVIKLDQSVLAPFMADGTMVSASFSPLRGIDPKPLLDSLAVYPYGCTEQLTASAWPLLYRNKLAGVSDGEVDFGLREEVQRAINKISARQSEDGAFGLWYAGDRYASGWIGAYVTDFLMRANAENYKVAETTLEKSFEALFALTSLDRWRSVSYELQIFRGENRRARTEQLRWRAVAYAHYILARAGKADLSDLRYFHDTFLDKIKNPLAKMHVGVALAMLGDRGRAANAFAGAEKSVGYDNIDNYYQSPMRDVAAILALAKEVENTSLVERMAAALDERMKSPGDMHTQEKMFLLLAITALLDRAGQVQLSVNADIPKVGTQIPSFDIDVAKIMQGITFKNEGAGPLFATVVTRGIPIKSPPSVQEGFELKKSVYTQNGQIVNLSAIEQNDKLVIMLKGRALDDRRHAAIIVDMLPAGFEIDAVLKRSDTTKGAIYEWVGEVSATKVSEARDDRFVAALDLYSDKFKNEQEFTLAYIVRAVTPGKFAMPGGIIEDMYRPGQFARTKVGTVEIAAPRENE